MVVSRICLIPKREFDTRHILPRPIWRMPNMVRKLNLPTNLPCSYHDTHADGGATWEGTIRCAGGGWRELQFSKRECAGGDFQSVNVREYSCWWGSYMRRNMWFLTTHWTDSVSSRIDEALRILRFAKTSKQDVSFIDSRKIIFGQIMFWSNMVEWLDQVRQTTNDLCKCNKWLFLTSTNPKWWISCNEKSAQPTMSANAINNCF